MHGVPESIIYFRRMFPFWHIVATEANGQSGGLVVLWDPGWIRAKAFRCLAGILLIANF